MVTAKAPLAAISPLLAAACALQPSPSHFTPLHAEFLKVCVLAKCYHAAAPLLSQELLHVDRDATLVSPRDLLLYFYYAGMVQTGLKRYASAVQYFTLCVSAPTNVLNTIMIEAYKKCAPPPVRCRCRCPLPRSACPRPALCPMACLGVARHRSRPLAPTRTHGVARRCLLCSLVQSGEPPRMPKYVSPSIARAIKTTLAPYTELADAFASGKQTDLRAALDKHGAAFAADHNLGLAKQTVPALMRRAIRTLTDTYLTLSLSDIAQYVGLPDVGAAERQIRAMIVSDEIGAAIDQPRGMVHFLEKVRRLVRDGTPPLNARPNAMRAPMRAPTQCAPHCNARPNAPGRLCDSAPDCLRDPDHLLAIPSGRRRRRHTSPPRRSP